MLSDHRLRGAASAERTGDRRHDRPGSVIPSITPGAPQRPSKVGGRRSRSAAERLPVIVAAQAVVVTTLDGVELVRTGAPRQQPDRPLRGLDRQRRQAGDGRAQLVDARCQPLGRHHLGEVTEPQQVGGRDRLGREEQAPGGVRPDPLDEAAQAAGVVLQADAGGGHAQHDALRRRPGSRRPPPGRCRRRARCRRGRRSWGRAGPRAGRRRRRSRPSAARPRRVRRGGSRCTTTVPRRPARGRAPPGSAATASRWSARAARSAGSMRLRLSGRCSRIVALPAGPTSSVGTPAVTPRPSRPAC